MRRPMSNPPPTRSTTESARCRSTETAGCRARKSGRSGATCSTPKLIGAASRTRPRGSAVAAVARASAASPSASSRAASSRAASPASVSASRREVRWNSRAPIRASSRPTAFETVPFDRPSSPAAPPKEPASTTLAKMAQASKSGRRMGRFRKR